MATISGGSLQYASLSMTEPPRDRQRASALQRLKRAIRQGMIAVGYDTRNWLRIAQIRSWEARLAATGPRDLLEISPGWNSHWAAFGGPGYRAANYPEFDVVHDRLDQQFDAVIVDQVIEHVTHPLAAMRNVRAMLRPGGQAFVAAPFLFPVHERPGDFWRWTEDGLRLLLVEAGFGKDRIETHAWGNARCVKAHLGGRIVAYAFGRDMHNDPELPVMVWAFATA